MPAARTLDRLRHWSPRSWGLAVFGLAFATSLAAVAALRLVKGGEPVDPYYFGQMGESIARGDGFAGFGSLLKRRTPGYPLLIGGLYWVFGTHATVVLVAHALMFAGTATLIFDIGRRLFNLRTGVLAGVLCAFHPLLLRYVTSLHLESQLIFLYTLTIWLMIRFRRQQTLTNAMLIGLVAGIAALTKAVVVLLPVVFVVGMLLERRSSGRNTSPSSPQPTRPSLSRLSVSIAALFVTMGLTILPWTIRNYQVTNHFVPLSTGTADAFLRGFIFSETKYITLSEPPYTNAEIASNQYFERLGQAAGVVIEADDWETDQLLQKEAKRRLREEPGAVARKTIIGVFTFWYQLTSLKNSLLVLVCAVGAWALALIGWQRARREHRSTWIVFAPILYLNLLLAPLLALGRYSAPVVPALMVMAAFGIDTLLRRFARGRAS